MTHPPRVVRIRRQNGIVVQDCDVYIGRACARGGWDLPQSKWYNPFSVRKYGSAERVCELYRAYILGRSDLLADLAELRGKTLGCWCAPGACHGDVLVDLYTERVDDEDE